jgi:hypothetical protein
MSGWSEWRSRRLDGHLVARGEVFMIFRTFRPAFVLAGASLLLLRLARVECLAPKINPGGQFCKIPSGLSQ